MLSGQLRGSWRNGARLVLAFLALRLMLIGNPVAWELYSRLLGPYDVGWRQNDAIQLKRDQFVRRAEPVRYLAVGSSQTGVIHGALARERADVAALSVAAMLPLDLVLYSDYIDRYRPQRVLLYLSDFDIARKPEPEAMIIAPPQRLRLFHVAARLRSVPDEQEYHGTVAAMAVGELFPEYKYRFVFRGLADKLLVRIAGTAEAQSNSGPERVPGEQHLAWARESMASEYIAFNMTLLRDFLEHATDSGTEVFIVEGHYNPVVLTSDIEAGSRTVRSALQAVAASMPAVSFVPREQVREFTESDYTDLSHVSAAAGHDFASRVIQLLESRSRPPLGTSVRVR